MTNVKAEVVRKEQYSAVPIAKVWDASKNSSDRIWNGSANSVCVRGIPGPWGTNGSVLKTDEKAATKRR